MGGKAGVAEDALQKIEDYNRDDVVSTWLLRDWLEERRDGARRSCGDKRCLAATSRPATRTRTCPSGFRQVDAVAEPLIAGHPRGRDRPRLDRRGTGPSAHGQSARLASARAEARLVALLQPAQRHDRRRPLRGSRAAVRCWSWSGRSVRRAGTFRYRFPSSRTSTSNVIRSNTANGDGHRGRGASNEEANEIVLRFKRGHDIVHPTSLVSHHLHPHQVTGAEPAGHRALRRWSTASMAEGPHRAARGLLLRAPATDRRTSLWGVARSCARCIRGRASAGRRTRPQRAGDPGPARLGQDLHGRADDPGPRRRTARRSA